MQIRLFPVFRESIRLIRDFLFHGNGENKGIGGPSMTLGARIKSFRNEKRITQKELADHLHVSFQTISKWENDENEPDVSSLIELSKVFGCSLDALLGENEEEQGKEEDKKEGAKENEPSKQEGDAPAPQTIIIHQKETHVCEKCKKDIPEDELEMRPICTRHARRGRSATYRQAYYHKTCLDEIVEEEKKAAVRKHMQRLHRSKVLSFGWGIAGAVVSFIISLCVFLNDKTIHPGFAVLYAVLTAYAVFAAIYCIISGSYLGDVFIWCAQLSIRFPGLIFTWDLDGIMWLIGMKILFAILGFLVGVFAILFAISLSMLLGAVSFPFVLIHNNRTDYEDALNDH